jgi:hypothetical protein
MLGVLVFVVFLTSSLYIEYDPKDNLLGGRNLGYAVCRSHDGRYQFGSLGVWCGNDAFNARAEVTKLIEIHLTDRLVQRFKLVLQLDLANIDRLGKLVLPPEVKPDHPLTVGAVDEIIDAKWQEIEEMIEVEQISLCTEQGSSAERFPRSLFFEPEALFSWFVPPEMTVSDFVRMRIEPKLAPLAAEIGLKLVAINAE